MINRIKMKFVFKKRRKGHKFVTSVKHTFENVSIFILHQKRKSNFHILQKLNFCLTSISFNFIIVDRKNAQLFGPQRTIFIDAQLLSAISYNVFDRTRILIYYSLDIRIDYRLCTATIKLNRCVIHSPSRKMVIGILQAVISRHINVNVIIFPSNAPYCRRSNTIRFLDW